MTQPHPGSRRSVQLTRPQGSGPPLAARVRGHTDDPVIANLGRVKQVGTQFDYCDPILHVVG
jgi:hypothetical protein